MKERLKSWLSDAGAFIKLLFTPRKKGEKVPSIFMKRQKPRSFWLGLVLNTVKCAIFAVLILATIGGGLLLGVAKAYLESTPTLELERIQDQNKTSFIYDANGKLITPYRGLENRIPTKLEDIPQILQDAFIAIEDVRFYSHPGVDFKRLMGAFVTNLQSGSMQGGSTITQQLIKLKLLTSEQTYKRKLQEAYLSLQLESQYTKPQILEAYLNTIHLGSSSYGVTAAAKDYFNKDLKDLTIRECAMLAGIARNPYGYNPRNNYHLFDKREVTDNRTDIVLQKMLEHNYINQEQYEQAKAEKVAVVESSTGQTLYEMPHFIEFGIYDVITHILADRKMQDTKSNRDLIDSELRTHGYQIHLSVDPEIQKTVEDSLYNWTKYPKMQTARDSYILVLNSDHTRSEIKQPQAAAVVLDYHTGLFKAIVGGRTAPTQMKELNRAYQAAMPVGSSIKPIAIYAPLLDMGYSPATIVDNMPARIEGWVNESGTGYPKNFDNARPTGPMSVRRALVSSINNVAARALVNLVTVPNSRNYLINMGIKPNHTLPDAPAGFALGTLGITTMEMSTAYATIANGGVYVEPLAFTKVVDSNGEVILDAEKIQGENTRQALKPSTAWMMIDMMYDAVQLSNGTGTRARIDGYHVAGKTGTSSDYTGVFFAGITSYYSASLWIGQDNNKPLASNATGGSYAAPLWKDFMAKILEGKEDKPFMEGQTAESLGLDKHRVCGVSGKLCLDACNQDSKYPPVDDYFLEGTVPKESCDMHYAASICSASGKLATALCPASERSTSSVILIPEKSDLRSMSLEQLSEYFPRVMMVSKQAADQILQNTDAEQNAQYVCQVHNPQWAEQTQRLAQLKDEARTLYVASKGKYDLYQQDIPQADRDRLSALLDALYEAYNSTSPDETSLRQAIDAVKDAMDTIIKPLEEMLPS